MKKVISKIIALNIIFLSSFLASSSQAGTLSDACRSRNAAIAQHFANINDDVKEVEDEVERNGIDQNMLENMLDDDQRMTASVVGLRVAMKKMNEEDKKRADFELTMSMADVGIRHYGRLDYLDKTFPNQHSHENVEGKRVKRLEFVLLAHLTPTRVKQNAQK